MLLIAGLGNPGPKYQKTRHNLGFRAVEEFQKENNFPNFKFSKKFNAEISEGILGQEKIILAKPQAFMNLSGQSVKSLILNLKPKTLIVIHDDIDLPLGKIKISKDSGAGGHKGVESIINYLKNKNFIRIRVGIQPGKGKPENVENFVIKNFTKEEEKILQETISKTTKAIEILLRNGIEKAMNGYNC